jgi:adenylylsulfate kinase
VKAVVLWFTGLSGSGKTTLALKLSSKLKKKGKKVKIIDGDEIRNSIHSTLTFSPKDIKKNNQLIAQLCKKYIDRYNFILVPIISPFRDSRVSAKSLIGSNFIEVYIKTTLETVIKRDVKGLYKKALNGEIKNFIGIDKKVPYEPPLFPEIIVNTELDMPEESVSKIIKYLKL